MLKYMLKLVIEWCLPSNRFVVHTPVAKTVLWFSICDYFMSRPPSSSASLIFYTFNPNIDIRETDLHTINKLGYICLQESKFSQFSFEKNKVRLFKLITILLSNIMRSVSGFHYCIF